MQSRLVDALAAHHSESWGWALACCEWQEALAEDALQESYLRVLDGRARYGGRASEKTWFFAVIKRVCSELRRQQWRRRLLAPLLPAEEDTQVPADEALDLDQANRQLREALLQMSSRQREVLHLVFYSELTLEEAANTLGLSLGSVRTHYHRGKTRLAELMEQDNE